MNDFSKSPYKKTAGISLLLHGALIAWLAMLGPPGPVEQPAVIAAIAVDIVPVAVTAAGDRAAPAPPASSPPAADNRPASRLLPVAARPEPAAQAQAPAAAADSSTTATAAASAADAAVAPALAVTARGGQANAGDGGGKPAAGGGRTKPAFIAGSRPAYPQAARKARWEGAVIVRIFIEADGTVTSAAVKAGSGYDILDEAAVQAVKKWRYSPAKEGGVPVASLHDVRVRFSLDEAD
ncbi:energy transducer TonB [Sporomusa termitida]|uniref:TonB C-terminal domain-containing protein n=1 Tax=Sporomusa termitida TaxID=2377 RepID=A0A517DR93_9FIRM|nr:energy transducer TonB [Sporomusa termitida]QDR79865.1 hypothetical protein SPTER_11670 [Sporomusa termitida]